jgi:hypothetical protein
MEVFESIDVEAQSIHKLLPRICKEKIKKKKKEPKRKALQFVKSFLKKLTKTT